MLIKLICWKVIYGVVEITNFFPTLIACYRLTLAIITSYHSDSITKLLVICRKMIYGMVEITKLFPTLIACYHLTLVKITSHHSDSTTKLLMIFDLNGETVWILTRVGISFWRPTVLFAWYSPVVMMYLL